MDQCNKIPPDGSNEYFRTESLTLYVPPTTETEPFLVKKGVQVLNFRISLTLRLLMSYIYIYIYIWSTYS